VRWDELFADIEGQLEHELSLERIGLAHEAERLRLARLTLGERLRGMSRGDRGVRLMLVDGLSLELRVESAGADWIAGEAHLGRSRRGVVVPIASVAAAMPSRDQLDDPGPGTAAPAPAALADRLGLAFVWRDLCRRRVVVELRTLAGVYHGTIDRVGADHLDLAERDPDHGSRPAAAARIRVVPFAAVGTVWV